MFTYVKRVSMVVKTRNFTGVPKQSNDETTRSDDDAF